MLADLRVMTYYADSAEFCISPATGESFSELCVGASRVPNEAATGCIEALREQGYLEAAVVGVVLDPQLHETSQPLGSTKLIKVV